MFGKKIVLNVLPVLVININSRQISDNSTLILYKNKHAQQETTFNKARSNILQGERQRIATLKAAIKKLMI